MTTATNPSLAGAQDLGAIIKAYAEVAERLKHSHEVLGREVCRLREQLAEKDKQLERRERLAALGEMAAGVAHEIRNPLGGIGLYASLLERDLADQPKQLDIIRRMQAGVRNLENIVSDILAFARGPEPVCRQVSLGEILDNVLAQSAPLARTREAVVEVDPALFEFEFWCDARQIERALSNLIFNALEAAGAGGRIEVKAGDVAGDSDFVTLAVADNGPGLEPDLLQRVFHPFFTTKDNGTGLGLAIVHRIVEAHGGHVTACNRAEGGALFILALPRGCRMANSE